MTHLRNRFCYLSATIAALLFMMGLNANAPVHAEGCSGTVTKDMVDCALNEYNALEIQRADIYKQLRKKISDEDGGRLMRAEEQWKRFRDQYCKFKAGFYEGGSLAPVIRLDCRAAITKEHIQHLNEELKRVNEL